MSLDDEDAIWLFERIVRELGKRFDHAEAEAVDLVNRYCQKFTDPDFCRAYDVPVQTMEFFAREESLAMADRVHFYVVLGNEPNESAFVEWEKRLEREKKRLLE
ncbi:hypothetical protein [Achromobacter sp. 413638]|uniref:hypothetical protein n=1 Tax=Achromobacter sp. 413638 TaxID=3342385 RepID=UPI00370A32FE